MALATEYNVKGTRIYWRPVTDSHAKEPQQILKNSGYVSIALQGVQYKSSGNWWQRRFKGTDKIAVSTQITWDTGHDIKRAAAVQDFRKIRVPSINALAISRNIAIKVPTVANGIELQVSITAVSDDNLAKTIQILNSDDFKQPLSLAPVAVGQVLTIANLVKKAFNNIDESQVLTATYASIISNSKIANPLESGRLVEGNIIVIVKQDDDDQLEFDATKFTITGNGLLYDGKPISNTYCIYTVSFDEFRGQDFPSLWSKKFDQALSKADDLMFAQPHQKAGIVQMALELTREGNTLLDADDNYTGIEKGNLKKTAFLAVTGKIKSNGGAVVSASTKLDSEFAGASADVNENIGPNLKSQTEAYLNGLASANLPHGFVFAQTMNATRSIPETPGMKRRQAQVSTK